MVSGAYSSDNGSCPNFCLPRKLTKLRVWRRLTACCVECVYELVIRTIWRIFRAAHYNKGLRVLSSPNIVLINLHTVKLQWFFKTRKWEVEQISFISDVQLVGLLEIVTSFNNIKSDLDFKRSILEARVLLISSLIQINDHSGHYIDQIDSKICGTSKRIKLKYE